MHCRLVIICGVERTRGRKETAVGDQLQSATEALDEEVSEDGESPRLYLDNGIVISLPELRSSQTVSSIASPPANAGFVLFPS